MCLYVCSNCFQNQIRVLASNASSGVKIKISLHSPIHLLDFQTSAGEPLGNCLHSSISSYLWVAFTSCGFIPLPYSALTTPSISFWATPLAFFSRGCHCRYFIGFLSSSILMTWPFHLSLYYSTSHTNGTTPSSSLFCVFLTLSFLVTLLINFNTL